MSNNKFNFTKEERNTIAEFVYSYQQDILIVSDAKNVLDVLNTHKIIDIDQYIELKKGVEEKTPGVTHAIANSIFGTISKEQGGEIMAEYYAIHSNAKQQATTKPKSERPFIGINVGNNPIDMRKHPTMYELRPGEIYLKTDGAKNDEPSFAIAMFDPNKVAAPVIGQLSLEMFNDGLADVGYQIVKTDAEVNIGENKYYIPAEVAMLIYNLGKERDELNNKQG